MSDDDTPLADAYRLAYLRELSGDPDWQPPSGEFTIEPVTSAEVRCGISCSDPDLSTPTVDRTALQQVYQILQDRAGTTITVADRDLTEWDARDAIEAIERAGFDPFVLLAPAEAFRRGYRAPDAFMGAIVRLHDRDCIIAVGEGAIGDGPSLTDVPLGTRDLAETLAVTPPITVRNPDGVAVIECVETEFTWGDSP